MVKIFAIDGQSFDVGVVKIRRGAPVLDKYAQRNEDGDMLRGIIGTYFNYYLTFPKLNSDSDAYDALYDKLTEPVEFHDIVVPWTKGTYSFRAYIVVSEDELMKYKEDGNHIWGNLQVSFIARSPARRPTI